MKNSYINIPAAAVGDKNLSHSHLAVLSALALFTNKQQTCYPSQQRLAQIVGMSRRSVLDKLKQLESQGYITKQARSNNDGGRSTNLYRIVFANNLVQSSLHGGSAKPAAYKQTTIEETKEKASCSANSSANEDVFDQLRSNKAYFSAYIKQQKLSLNVADEINKFENFCKSVGKTYIDYNSGFKLWLDRAKNYAANGAARAKKTEVKQPSGLANKSPQYKAMLRVMSVLGSSIAVQPHETQQMLDKTKLSLQQIEKMTLAQKKALLDKLGI